MSDDITLRASITRGGVESWCDIIVEGDLFEFVLCNPGGSGARFLEREFTAAVVGACQAFGEGRGPIPRFTAEPGDGSG